MTNLDTAVPNGLFEQWAKLTPEQRDYFAALQEGFRHAVDTGQAPAGKPPAKKRGPRGPRKAVGRGATDVSATETS